VENLAQKFINSDLFSVYTMTLDFKEKLCGGIPKSEKAIEGWIRANVEDKSKLEQMVADTKESMNVDNLSESDLENLAKSAWNGFKSDERGLYIEGRQIKSMFKESANVIKNVLNVSAFKARIAERVFVVEDKVHLRYSGLDIALADIFQEPSGSYEGMVHAMTAMGKISALKRVDYVEKAYITFTLKILNEKIITKDKKRLDVPQYIMHLITHSQENGLGAERSQGNGKFNCSFFGLKEEIKSNE